MLMHLMLILSEQMEPVMVEVQRPSREEPRVEGRMVKVDFDAILRKMDDCTSEKFASLNNLVDKSIEQVC